MGIKYLLSLDEKINNFGGSAMNIGTSIDSLHNGLHLVNLNQTKSYNHPHSSVPVQNADTKKAIENFSVFSFNNDRPIVKGYTKLLNNVIIAHGIGTTGSRNTNIISSIHFKSTNKNRLDTTAIRYKQYSMSTGKFDIGLPLVFNDNFGQDNAVAISRTNPGTLCFKSARKTESKSYKTKTG